MQSTTLDPQAVIAQMAESVGPLQDDVEVRQGPRPGTFTVTIKGQARCVDVTDCPAGGPVDAEAARQLLGRAGFGDVTPGEARGFLIGARGLLAGPARATSGAVTGGVSGGSDAPLPASQHHLEYPRGVSHE